MQAHPDTDRNTNTDTDTDPDTKKHTHTDSTTRHKAQRHVQTGKILHTDPFGKEIILAMKPFILYDENTYF